MCYKSFQNLVAAYSYGLKTWNSYNKLDCDKIFFVHACTFYFLLEIVKHGHDWPIVP